MNRVNLEQYKKDPKIRGRSIVVDVLWNVVQFLFISSFQPFSSLRILFLRLFGAKIGQGVVIKPFVKIKFPWKLQIGDHTWIGESVWIDNLDEVMIGNHCCLSQLVYICTGDHDWKSSRFDLTRKPVKIDDNAWLCARSTIAPGVKVGEGAVLTIGSVAIHDLDAWVIYSGNPAQPVKRREIVNNKD
jgi:putative colanic acid biosynthesis acetyltransferase WcaF